MKLSIIRGWAWGLTIGLLMIPQIESAAQKTETPLEHGKTLTMESCQACHFFDGADQAGTVGPPLVAMKVRFPERKRLEEIIYDPHTTRPYSMMPPFGRNGLLDRHQIQLIVDFLYTL